MKPALIVASAISSVGFCINAALVRCRLEQGDRAGAEDAAYQGIAWLLVAVVLGTAAWMVK